MSRVPDTAWPAELAADAQRVLTGWTAPTPADEVARARVLEFVGDQGPAAATRALRAGHLTASAILLDASHRQVLLTLHHLARQWFQLGGHLEAGDAGLPASALREATEESGIAGITVDPVPLGVDWHAVTCRDVDGVPRPSQHLDMTFLTVAPPGAQPQISGESLDLRWFDVSDLPGSVDDPVRRCVAEALRRLA